MNKNTWLIIGALGTALTYTAHAWVAAGHGEDAYGHNGYYHSNYYHGSYYYNGWAAHGLVVGVPAGVYYGYGCGWVQQSCNHSGCVTERVCQ